MGHYTVCQMSGGQVKHFPIHLGHRAIAQYKLWERMAWSEYHAGNPKYRETTWDGDCISVRPRENMFPSIILVTAMVDKPTKKQDTVSKALQRGAKPPKQAPKLTGIALAAEQGETIERYSISNGEPFGHPYVPSPDEVVYPDYAVLTH